MIIISNLHSGTKLSGWLRHCQLLTTGKIVGIVFWNTSLFDAVLRISTQLWNTSWTTNI